MALRHRRRDITERKRSDEALRVSEASYRAIFDAAEDAIFVHDIETGAIVDVNPKACATFGYTREEFRQLDVGALGSGERPYTQRGRDGTDRPRGCRRAAAHRMARQEQGWQLALARSVRQARDHRRTGSNTGARARHHRPQDGRGGVARERRAVSRHVQCVDRRTGAVERRRRDRRYQSRAVADVRLQRRRVLRVAARQLDGPVVSPRVSRSGRRRRIAALGGDGAAQGRLARWSSRCTASRCSIRASRTC